jgi:hypothetical protein
MLLIEKILNIEKAVSPKKNYYDVGTFFYFGRVLNRQSYYLKAETTCWALVSILKNRI